MSDYRAITYAQLRNIMPCCTDVRATLFLPFLNAAMEEFEIDTTARQAAFLAQIAHESGSLAYTRELATGEAYDGRIDLGNTRPEALEIARQKDSTPGRLYKGRGLIQITGYANYFACSRALFGDGGTLTHNPVMLERKELAARSAAWFWKSRGLNALADAGLFESITRRVNGGLNGQRERLAFFERAKEVLA